MSEKEEQIKKKIAEEMRNRDSTQIDQEALLKKAASEVESLDEPMAKEEDASVQTNQFQFKPKLSKTNKKDWELILEDYQERYKDRPIKDDVLEFSSLEEATEFFNKHATAVPPLKFLAAEVDLNNKLTGYNLYSCGSNKLYKGTFQQIHKELTADLKEKPSDPNLKEGLAEINRFMNPTSGFKAAFKEIMNEEQVAESSPPNPLSTKPKPPFV